MGSASALSDVSWWEGNYYPAAGEVVAWREHRGRRDGPTPPPQAKAGPPAVAEGNAQRAIRRARTRIRRYAAANLLNRLVVLTWRDQGDELAVARQHVRAFIRYGLRVKLRYTGAYVIGWERHKSGAWHANVLVSRYIDHAELERAWGRGFVWISRFAGAGGRDGARKAARYVAKYVAKDLDGIAERGSHRYEIAQGFAVRVVRVYGTSPTSLLGTIGRPVVYRFDAIAPEVGRGPPMMWAALGGTGRDTPGSAEGSRPAPGPH
jgi:hypothetical protein